MAHATTLPIAHLPPQLSVHVALFTSVTNAAFLRAQLLAGNTAFEYAFIDASTLLSRTHLYAAIFRACCGLVSSRLRTRNVHAETVFALSPTNNIAESFKRFGVGDETTRLVAVKVSHPGSEVSLAEVQKHLDEVVDGTSVEFTDDELFACTDWALVRKVYKLQPLPAQKGANGIGPGGLTHIDRAQAEISVLGMMALKGS